MAAAGSAAGDAEVGARPPGFQGVRRALEGDRDRERASRRGGAPAGIRGGGSNVGEHRTGRDGWSM